MIQNIRGNNSISTIETFNPLQTIKKAQNNSYSDSFLKTETLFSTIPDVYSNKMEEPISPSDEKYFGIASNGTNTLRFPADNAPLSAKKAWVEAMKSLTPDEQFMAKTEIFIRVPSRAFGFGNAQNFINNITSYQDFLNKVIAENKKNLTEGAGLDADDRKAIRHMVEIDQSILNIFRKYNVK